MVRFTFPQPPFPICGDRYRESVLCVGSIVGLLWYRKVSFAVLTASRWEPRLYGFSLCCIFRAARHCLARPRLVPLPFTNHGTWRVVKLLTLFNAYINYLENVESGQW